MTLSIQIAKFQFHQYQTLINIGLSIAGSSEGEN